MSVLIFFGKAEKGVSGIKKRKYKRLHFEDRELMERMLKEGSSVAEIAGKIGVHRDTIYRELQRSGAGLNGEYTAEAGQRAL